MKFPKIDKENLTRNIFLLLGSGIVLTSAILAPNVSGLLSKKLVNWSFDLDFKKLKRAIFRLRKLGYLGFDRDGKIILTKKGWNRAAYYKVDGIKIERPKKWDGKWRVIIFDIPNQKNEARDYLRAKIAGLGFVKLQKSVWLLPWECKKEIDQIKNFYGLRKNVIYLLVEKIDNEKLLKKKFSL